MKQNFGPPNLDERRENKGDFDPAGRRKSDEAEKMGGGCRGKWEANWTGGDGTAKISKIVTADYAEHAETGRRNFEELKRKA